MAAGYPPPAATPATPVTPVARPSAVGLAIRVLLTLVGAAGLVIGAFLNWISDVVGTEIKIDAFWRTQFSQESNIVMTVGFVMIVLGLLAIIGLAPRTGWLTRLAGAAGVVAFVLFLIEVYRAVDNSDVRDLQEGIWICLAGAVLALIGGFFGSRAVVTATSAATTTDVVEP